MVLLTETAYYKELRYLKRHLSTLQIQNFSTLKKKKKRFYPCKALFELVVLKYCILPVLQKRAVLQVWSGGGGYDKPPASQLESKPSGALHTAVDSRLGKEAVDHRSVTQAQSPFNFQPSVILAVHQCWRGKRCVNPKGRRPQEQRMWWHITAASSASQGADTATPICSECKQYLRKCAGGSLHAATDHFSLGMREALRICQTSQVCPERYDHSLCSQ